MIFEYEELKECVEEDFGLVENICIHVFLILLYAKECLDCSKIINKLNQLMNEEVEREIMAELGNEYSKFITDLNMARNNK